MYFPLKCLIGLGFYVEWLFYPRGIEREMRLLTRVNVAELNREVSFIQSC